MLITFETKAYANITMFGDIAKKLIKFMGHSGMVPGAIKAKDLPKALERLQTAVCVEMENSKENKKKEEDESEEFISIDKRAKPLIEMLKAAIERNTDVMWDE